MYIYTIFTRNLRKASHEMILTSLQKVFHPRTFLDNYVSFTYDIVDSRKTCMPTHSVYTSNTHFRKCEE